jgi:chemotaxis protein MotB
MRKKKGHADHENAERWLLTYADMITLLMAFFIMMYSMSVLNMSKFQEAAISIRSGFGGIIQGQGKSVLAATGSFSPKPSPIAGASPGVDWKVVKPLVTYIEKDAKLRKNTLVSTDERGVVVSMLSDNLLFDSGSAEINERAYPLLNKIAEMLDKLGNCVRIEGHTCDLPPRPGGRYPTNWELSSSRATNVLRYLTESKGLDPRFLSPSGCAGFHPLVPNTCEANRRRNRRVDIVIVAGEAPPPLKPVAKPIVEPVEKIRPIAEPPAAKAAPPSPELRRPAAADAAPKPRPVETPGPTKIDRPFVKINLIPDIRPIPKIIKGGSTDGSKKRR